MTFLTKPAARRRADDRVHFELLDRGGSRACVFARSDALLDFGHRR